MKKVIFASLMFVLLIGNCYALEENKEVKYFKTIISDNEQNAETFEISREEYENQSSISLLATGITTEYKMLSISQHSDNISLDLEWKKTPKYRSYDVIALRGENVNFQNSSIAGIQSYNLNNSNQKINYNSNSGNIKSFSNGFGLSMNLVDNATSYKMTLKVKYSVTGSNPKIYGTYQHSQRNISLAQSKSYSLSASGYGKVLLFDNTVKSYFDAMDGVSISL